MSELSDRIDRARKIAETVGVDRAARGVGRLARTTVLNSADTLGKKVSEAAQSAKAKPRSTGPRPPKATTVTVTPPARKSTGTRRTYTFADRDIVVDNVIEVTIQGDGGHLLRTVDGQEHQLRPQWLAVTVESDPPR